MKKTTLKTFAAAACSVATLMYQGCMKTEITAVEAVSEERFPLSVSIPPLDAGGQTKALTNTGEKTISDLQVFIFRENGVLDAYGHETSSSSVEVNCTAGKKNIMALVNAPALSSVSSMTELAAATSNLSDNSLGRLVMANTEAVSKEITTSANTAEINVTRLVARVSVEKISNLLSADQYASTPIKIKKIFMTNVAGDRLYLNPTAPKTWLNKQGRTLTDVPALLASDDLDAQVEAQGSYTTPHYFYCYPNSTEEDSSEETWSPRHTRLVVQAEILGAQYYYPVTFDEIKSNHTYTIKDLQITRLGSTSPDVPVSTGTLTVTISVVDWTTGSSTTIVI